MASFAAAENCFLDQSCDELNIDELLSIDTSLLMSFLEDLEAEDGDGEMLGGMIQSCSETDESSEECCSTYLDHHSNFEWIDLEMEYSCPGYYAENMVEYGGIEDYSQVCDGMAMEEDDYIGLWQ